MFLFSGRKRQHRDVAEALYRKIVNQARHPVFFVELGVPDTAEGRFEMIALHLFAVTRRLLRADADDPDLARSLAEAFVADLDGNLREMGVGDLSVGRKVKGLYAAYGGRVSAYDVALSAEGGAAAADRADALEAAIALNIYAGNGPPDGPGRMAAYMRRLVAGLDAVPLEAIRRSAFEFADPVGANPGGDRP